MVWLMQSCSSAADPNRDASIGVAVDSGRGGSSGGGQRDAGMAGDGGSGGEGLSDAGMDAGAEVDAEAEGVNDGSIGGEEREGGGLGVDCADLVCMENAHCDDSDSPPSCTCDDGFVGDGNTACEDIDECDQDLDDCDDDPEACVNTVGGFECVCPSGYTGDGADEDGCIDIDECGDGLDDCDNDPDACLNETPGFHCQCPSGYSGDGTGSDGCTDIDECVEGVDGHSACTSNAGCTDEEGSYSCACLCGTVGDPYYGGTCDYLVFHATEDMTLQGGSHIYSSFMIDAGVTVTVIGTESLDVESVGNVVIAGALVADGESGPNAATPPSSAVPACPGDTCPGGAGGPGGHTGGHARTGGLGDDGHGPGGGNGGYNEDLAWWGSGGGGGSFGTEGTTGHDGYSAEDNQSPYRQPGTVYGDVELAVFEGGSGGGAGGDHEPHAAAGTGGGGGGAVRIIASQIEITESGIVSCRGGNGGDALDNNWSAAGGAGSGGAIWLRATSLDISGALDATGGTGGWAPVLYGGRGGNGGDGRIRLDYDTISGSGSVQPAAGYTEAFTYSPPVIGPGC